MNAFSRTLSRGLSAVSVALALAACVAGTPLQPSPKPSSLPGASLSEPSPTPTATLEPFPSVGPSATPAPLTNAQAGEAYLAAAHVYATGLKAVAAADDKSNVPWCGTRVVISGTSDPCLRPSVMAASVRDYQRFLSGEAKVIGTFVTNIEAIRFPTALIPQAAALIAAAGTYGDQIAAAALLRQFPDIELAGITAGFAERPAQDCSNALRKQLGLRALVKPYPWRYEDGVF